MNIQDNNFIIHKVASDISKKDIIFNKNDKNHNQLVELVEDKVIVDANDGVNDDKQNFLINKLNIERLKEGEERLDKSNSKLSKFLKKFSKKVFVKTLTKLPYSVGGYLGAKDALKYTLKWGAPVLELPFAYKDYKSKLEEGRSKKEALLETGVSFLSGNLVAFGIGSLVGGPIGLALSVVGGALAGTLADKITHKLLAKK